MTVYALAQFRIHDRARYDRYAARFPEVLARYGGRVVIAEEAPRVVEGTWNVDKIVLLAFADVDAFERFSSSDEYQKISVDRVAATEGAVVMVRGLEARSSGTTNPAV
jgi:uncharacterized protein (DUF1330 family)